MDQEIVPVITSALIHQKLPAHIRIMNAKSNAKGAITGIKHLNATAELAVQDRDIIITAARTVAKGVVDVQETECLQWLKIHAVPVTCDIGKGTDGMHKMREEFEAENEGIVIHTQVRCLPNPRTIRERRENGEVAEPLEFFVVKGSHVAQILVTNGINAAGVCYRVETYTNEAPDSRGELCCRWGHIENNCCNKSKCGSCSGHHRTSDHMCIAVGCTAQQG
jgi:hypothetical protein